MLAAACVVAGADALVSRCDTDAELSDAIRRLAQGERGCRRCPAKITPAEFEQFVVELLDSVGPLVESLEVTLHDKIQGTDGVYDFDATVRFGLAGMRFLVLVEAKRHKNPIKRELVQVLHDSERQAMSRQQAADQLGLPEFVGHAYGPAGQPASTSVTLVSAEYPSYVAEALLGVSVNEPTD